MSRDRESYRNYRHNRRNEDNNSDNTTIRQTIDLLNNAIKELQKSNDHLRKHHDEALGRERDLTKERDDYRAKYEEMRAATDRLAKQDLSRRVSGDNEAEIMRTTSESQVLNHQPATSDAYRRLPRVEGVQRRDAEEDMVGKEASITSNRSLQSKGARENKAARKEASSTSNNDLQGVGGIQDDGGAACIKPTEEPMTSAHLGITRGEDETNIAETTMDDDDDDIQVLFTNTDPQQRPSLHPTSQPLSSQVSVIKKRRFEETAPGEEAQDNADESLVFSNKMSGTISGWKLKLNLLSSRVGVPSPSIKIADSSWNMEAKKTHKANKVFLSVGLHKNGGNELTATFTIKCIGYRDHIMTRNKFQFNRIQYIHLPTFLDWDQLTNMFNGYVDEDGCVEIEAEILVHQVHGVPSCNNPSGRYSDGPKQSTG